MAKRYSLADDHPRQYIGLDPWNFVIKWILATSCANLRFALPGVQGSVLSSAEARVDLQGTAQHDLRVLRHSLNLEPANNFVSVRTLSLKPSDVGSSRVPQTAPQQEL